MPRHRHVLTLSPAPSQAWHPAALQCCGAVMVAATIRDDDMWCALSLSSGPTAAASAGVSTAAAACAAALTPAAAAAPTTAVEGSTATNGTHDGKWTSHPTPPAFDPFSPTPGCLPASSSVPLQNGTSYNQSNGCDDGLNGQSHHAMPTPPTHHITDDESYAGLLDELNDLCAVSVLCHAVLCCADVLSFVSTMS
jgi:hypothetical protein